MIPQVVVSERGGAQTAGVEAPAGLKDPHQGRRPHRGTVLGRRAEGGESPVPGMRTRPAGILSSAGPEESRVNLPAPSGKAEHYRETDSERVP